MALHPPGVLAGVEVIGSSSLVTEWLLISIFLSSLLLSNEHIITLTSTHTSSYIIYVYMFIGS